jgi:hypothetical protein
MLARIAPLALLLVACGDGNGTDDDDPVADGPLDCAWFEGDNCWRDQLALATVTCALPDEEGLLAPTHDRCTFADGTEVIFYSDLNLEGDGPEEADLEVRTPGGSSCRLVATDELSLTVDETVVQQQLDGLDVYMECPDGAVYGPIGAFELLECDWSDLPGYSWSYTADSIQFATLGDDGLSFSCSEAATTAR